MLKYDDTPSPGANETGLRSSEGKAPRRVPLGVIVAIVLWIPMASGLLWLKWRELQQPFEAKRVRTPKREDSPKSEGPPKREGRTPEVIAREAEINNFVTDGTRDAFARAYVAESSPSPAKLAKARELIAQKPRQTEHAVMWLHGIGGQRDVAHAVRLLRRETMAGDEWAPVFLASVLARGDAESGVAAEPAEARRLLTDAAERKSNIAATLLARLDEGADLADIVAGVLPENGRQPKPRPAFLPEIEMPRARSPEAIFQARPIYPHMLRFIRASGMVVVDFVVATDGSVQNPYVIKSTVPGFERSAVAAVQQWKFKPGVADGRYVPTHMQVPVIFKIDEETAEEKPRSLLPAGR